MLHDLSSEQEVDLLPRPALVSLGQPCSALARCGRLVGVGRAQAGRQLGKQAGKKAISTRVNQQDMPQEDRPSGRLASPRPAGWLGHLVVASNQLWATTALSSCAARLVKTK